MTAGRGVADATTLFTNARLVFAADEVLSGWLLVDRGHIAAFDEGPADAGQVSAAGSVVDCGGDWLSAGFVDIHVHGGGGGDFMAPDPAVRRRVRALHARHGTTAMLASTVSEAPDTLLAAVGRLGEDASELQPDTGSEVTESPDGRTSDDVPVARLLGIHLEGPFLSHKRRGAHDERALREPDLAEFARLLDAGRGWVRTITLAPELPGGMDLVRAAVAAGLVVSLGHTDADAETLREAVRAGATGVTHTYNGMRPLHHRAPGGVGIAMDEPALTCELIVDGFHVDPIAARALVHAAGADRVCLITDAMAAAGMADGRFELGGSVVEVRGGRVSVSGTDVLAGSTLTMGRAVRLAVSTLGLDVPTAVAMATQVPAQLVPDAVGTLTVGSPADIVRLGTDASVKATYIGGQEVPLSDPHTSLEGVS